MVFGIKNIELVNEYYIFQINEKGNLSLIKNENGKYKNLENKIKYIENFNKNNTYKMEISFNPKNGNIITYINDQLIYFVKDKSLNGKLIGFISHGKNTIIKQIIAEENEII